MKKINLTILLTLIICLTPVSNLKAQSLIPGLLDDYKSRPQTIFSDEDKVYNTIPSSEFNYGKIAFNIEDTDKRLIGRNNIRKAILFEEYIDQDNKISNSWFTAYSLDANLIYPSYGLYSYDKFTSPIDDKKYLELIIMSYLLNNELYKDKFIDVKDYDLIPEVTFKLEENKTIKDVINDFNNNKEIIINIETLKFKRTIKDNEEFDINNIIIEDTLFQDNLIISKELNSSHFTKEAKFIVKINKKDLLFNKYKENDEFQEKYDHAMWIVDNSYPTLELYELYKIINRNTNLITEDLVKEGKLNTKFELVTEEEYFNVINKFNKVYNKNLIANYDSLNNIRIENNTLKSDKKVYAIYKININESQLGSYDIEGSENLISYPIPHYLINDESYLSNLNLYLTINNDKYGEYVKLKNEVTNTKSITLEFKHTGTYYIILNVENGTNIQIKPSYTKKLINEIAELEQITTLKDYEYYIDNYVYSTIQYAIWKTTNTYDEKLGNQIEGSTELNKLYNYLLNNNHHKNYTDYKYSNILKLTEPNALIQLVKEDEEYYTYGPYYAITDALVTNKVKVSAENNKIKILDKNYNENSVFEIGEEFYIKIKKNDNIVTTKITLYSEDNTILTNKSKIYETNNIIFTKLASSVSTNKKDLINTYEIFFKPKKKEENFAIILVIMLVSISLGFLILNYKSKNIEN